jgi:hypothetical protein
VGCHDRRVAATTGSSAFGFIVVGTVFVVIPALTDFRHWVSNRYEDTEGRKVGFQAISGSANTYRGFIGVFGAIFLIFGVAAWANA